MNLSKTYTVLFTIIIFATLLRLLGAIFALIIIFSCMILCSMIFLKRKNLNIKNKFLIFVFYTYSCTILLAAVIHSDNRVFQNILFNTLLFFTLITFFGSTTKSEGIKIISRSTVASYIPFIVICFLYNPTYSEPFRGVFTNSNAMGLSMLGLFIVLITQIYIYVLNFLKNRESIPFLKLAFLILLYCVGLYIVFISNSRASLLAIILGTVFMVILLFVKIRSNLKSTLKALVLMNFLIGLIWFLILKIPLLNQALNSILFKFQLKSNSDRLTSGRVDIWNMVINKFSFWGHGKEAFNDLGISHAHNVFLDILQVSGVLPFIIYTLFIVLLIIYAVKSFYVSDDPSSIIILITLIIYLMAGTVEAFDYDKVRIIV